MRLDDRTMTLLTALVLAVVVGVIAQQSNRIMELFSDRSTAALADDYFMVKAGKQASLDLLLNDRLDNVEGEVVVVARPRCGTVSVSRSIVVYEGGNECAGHVTFTYCVDGTETCEPALVSMNVRKSNADVRVVATDRAPLKTAPEPAPKAEEKISVAVRANVQEVAGEPVETALAVTLEAPEMRAEPKAGLVPLADLARLVADTSKLDFSAAPQRLEGFELAVLSNGAPDAAELRRFLAPARKLSPMIASVPVGPEDVGALEPLRGSANVGRAIFGGCESTLSLTPGATATVVVAVNAPCFAGRVAHLVHAGIAFEFPLDDTGNGRAPLPAFAEVAEFTLHLPGTDAPVSAMVRVPAMRQIARAAVTVDRASGLNLRAREWRQQQGRPRLVDPVLSRGPIVPDVRKGGTISSYRGTDARNIFVYSARRVDDADPVLTELVLTGTRDKSCARMAEVHVLLTDRIAARAQRSELSLPDCTSGGLWESHLRDMVVASR